MIKINHALEFHLCTKNSSYVMKVLPSSHLVNLHYGKRLRHQKDFSYLYQNFNTDIGNSTSYHEKFDPFTLDTTRLELATSGKGDYREPSLHIEYDDYTTVSDFTYHNHRVIKGKPGLDTLPHAHGTEGIETLIITLRDKIKDVYLHLNYHTFYESDVIVRSMTIENGQQGLITLEKAMSFNFDMNNSQLDLISLEGKWIREGQINKRPLHKGITSIDSKKGVSGSSHPPFICLADKDTGELHGECYGFGLVYSGNHQCLVEVSPYDLTRVHMGISPFDFRWTLDKGEHFQTPEVMMTFTPNGLSQMSHQFHNMINNHLIPTQWQHTDRPILFNNWEATYFQFNEKKLVDLAKAAKTLGIELFVLDDGWFGQRDDDKSSLGDFFEHRKKLPNGLSGLSKKIRALGLDFGIWVEPEMISTNSDLYKKHPEWAVQLLDRDPSLGRHQLVLDMTNPDVITYLFKALSKVFKDGHVTYVKWDMNRNFSDVYSNYLKDKQQRSFNHRYTLGLYHLLSRLTEKFPKILFESCSSGGNRFDLGMLYYMPQTWTSDNTDALERQSIQYGMSHLFPLSTMAAHVSGEPSHQVLRHTPIESRFNVAAFGVLGYEMDITKLTVFEKKVIKNQIAYYKQHRKLLQYGQFTRLQSPFEHNQSHWMVTNSNQSEAIVGYYQKLQESNSGFEAIKLKHLKSDDDYDISNRTQYINIRHFGPLINDEIPINVKVNGLVHSMVSNRYMYETEKFIHTVPGDQLMSIGLLPQHQFVGTELNENIRYVGDYGSRIYHLQSNQEKKYD